MLYFCCIEWKMPNTTILHLSLLRYYMLGSINIAYHWPSLGELRTLLDIVWYLLCLVSVFVLDLFLILDTNVYLSFSLLWKFSLYFYMHEALKLFYGFDLNLLCQSLVEKLLFLRGNMSRVTFTDWLFQSEPTLLQNLLVDPCLVQVTDHCISIHLTTQSLWKLPAIV